MKLLGLQILLVLSANGVLSGTAPGYGRWPEPAAVTAVSLAYCAVAVGVIGWVRNRGFLAACGVLGSVACTAIVGPAATNLDDPCAWLWLSAMLIGGLLALHLVAGHWGLIESARPRRLRGLRFELREVLGGVLLFCVFLGLSVAKPEQISLGAGWAFVLEPAVVVAGSFYLVSRFARSPFPAVLWAFGGAFGLGVFELGWRDRWLAIALTAPENFSDCYMVRCGIDEIVRADVCFSLAAWLGVCLSDSRRDSS